VTERIAAANLSRGAAHVASPVADGA